MGSFVCLLLQSKRTQQLRVRSSLELFESHVDVALGEVV